MKEIKKDEYTEKEKKIRNTIAISVFIISLVLLFMLIISRLNLDVDPAVSDPVAQNKDFVYLSDIPYDIEKSSAGWGNITLDTTLDSNNNNGLISLIVEGVRKIFFKGITAHATSAVIYDISDYDYDYFSTYYGVDASRGTTSDGVKFAISTSVDGENWDLHTLVSPPVKKGNTEAEFINIDVRDKKYIKLYCLQYGNATGDHCVYAGAKLYKEGYDEGANNSVGFIKTVAEYDEILKNLSLEDQINNNELVILQREFVNNAGYDILQGLALLDQEYEDTLRWLMTDVENLRLYITGGKPTGSYVNSIKTLTNLYTNYKDDFEINTVSKYGNNIGDLYKRMAITLSLTHSSQVALWMQPSNAVNQSDAVTRYAIFKKLYDEGKFVVSSSIDISKWFESYTIEEMRFVMNNIIDDESILWLNEYTQKQIDAHPNQVWTYLTPHPYMAYVWPNYGNPVFHDPDKKDYWDQKYDGIFSKYGVSYTTPSNKIYKVWMNFRNEYGTGAVCGGISKTGSNIRTVHGIPAAVIGQPGHAAIMYYMQNDKGEGYWGIDNDISGWSQSEKGERLLLGWGSDRRYNRGYAFNLSYLVMAQEAVNRFDSYQKSSEILMLANVYNSDYRKKEEYIRASLNELDFNVDAWYSLIELYINDTSKTEEDFYNLAREMSESLMEYPLAYYNFMALIKPHLESNSYKFSYNLLLENTLVKGKNYTGTDVLQPSVTRTMATRLLGQADTSLATFSFNGDDAGKIVLSSRFDGSGIRWDYSLDGKTTWHEVSFTGEEEHKYQLTKSEIESITAENDIYIHIVGANYNDENVLKIDITENVINASSYFRNDLENRIMGINLLHEWRNSDNEEWTSYSLKSPDNTGDKTLQIRVAANGTKLASNVLTFSFTADNQPDTRKYIPVSHLSINAVSTEATSNQGKAAYAIDGNYNTRWHSAWNGSDTERYITIKIDQPVILTAVEFVPAGGGNGKIYDGTIWGSIDGENWVVLSKKTNLTYTNAATTNEQAIANTKAFEIENPQLVQYVKIVADRTNGNWFAARAFNLYQNIAQNPNPTASVGFDITESTNKNVTARLINPSTEIEITNNGGSDTYVFTENGEFTFEFRDKVSKLTGKAIAKVNWIDKEAPTATIRYSITSKTNGEVSATLVPSEEITVTNRGFDTEQNSSNHEAKNILALLSGTNADPLTVVFLDNGEFTFEFVDKAGNVGQATAKVDWIDRVAPNGMLTYSTMELTNQDVVVSIEFDKENVRVTNNDGKTEYVFTENGEFTFEFVDEAGNTNVRRAFVNWIDKVAPNASITYSTTKSTTEPVTATITSDEYIKITNNNGSNIYTFTENGSFEFTYEDILGNKGKITANVSWIKSETNQNPGNNPNVPENPGDNNNNNNNNGNNNNSNGGNNNTNNPGNSSNNNSNNNNEGNNGNDNNNNNNPSETEKYKNFVLDNIKVIIPSKDLKEDVTLKENEFVISSSLKNKFGSSSEFLELYIENNINEKINLSSDVKLVIKLDTTKEFLGVFRIKDNNTIETLKYKVLDDNFIQVQTDNLGKFVISYGENQGVVKEEKSSNLIWYIVLGVILISCITNVIVRKRNINKERQN